MPSFTSNIGINLNSQPLEDISQKIKALTMESEQDNVPSQPQPSQPALQRPMKQLKKSSFIKPCLTLESLPSFAATPKSSPILISQVRDTIDIPPADDEDQQEQEPDKIKQKLSNCFEFNSKQMDQGDRILATIFFGIETNVPDITQWFKLKSLNLSRCNLTRLNHLDTCFPMLETLDM